MSGRNNNRNGKKIQPIFGNWSTQNTKTIEERIKDLEKDNTRLLQLVVLPQHRNDVFQIMLRVQIQVKEIHDLKEILKKRRRTR